MRHRISGKTCSFYIDLPKNLDEDSKRLLTRIMGYCLDRKYKKSVLESVNDLENQIKTLMRSLKSSGKYDKSVERGVREFVGMHLNDGFEIGINYTPRDEGRDLIEVIEDEADFWPIVDNLPKSKQGVSEIIFFCLDLGRLAFETGLMLSYYVSEDMVEKHQKQLSKATSYIG